MSPGREGLADQLARRLVEAVTHGVYSPGSLLPSEPELASREGVSRLTVREAIRTLRQKNVVRIERGRGTFVNPVSVWSPLDADLLAARTGLGESAVLRAVLEARHLVEVGVAELAAARRDDRDLEALRSALRRMREAGDDVAEFVDADIAFHQALMDSARNAVITALFEPVSSLVYEARRETSQDPQARDHAISAHDRILVAVTRQDAAAARTSMNEHLLETERDVNRRRPATGSEAEPEGTDG